jgi:amidase
LGSPANFLAHKEDCPVSDDPTLWSATRLAAAVRSRNLSSHELLDAFAAKIGRLNPAVNAVVTTDMDRAHDRANRADQAAARNEWLGPLHGLPFTVKDAIETGGMRSTGGAPQLADHVPAVDAPAVARLSAAGGVLFGKTNAPTWSADFQTHNELFGMTNNPWDLARTTGGSSGGSAAAVASGFGSFELGTDIGGSVRIPSSFCGVFGHKPSFGVVPQRGYLDHVGGGTIDADINVFGPLARSVEDLELLMDVLVGPVAEDAVAWRLQLPEPRSVELKGLRIGAWMDDPEASVDTEVCDVLDAAVRAFSSAGASISTERPPLRIDQVFQLFLGLTGAAAALSIDPSTSGLSGITLRQVAELRIERARVRAVWSEWFSSYDVLLCPVMPMAAIVHDTARPFMERTTLINGEPRAHMDCTAWTGLVGVAYLPSTVIPVGRTRSGLPVGMQVVGPYLEDRTSLRAARLLSATLGEWQAPPFARG